LKKARVGREAEHAASLLARHVAPCLIGYHPVTESVLSKQEKLCEMPPATRQLAPKETIADRSWVKLKRGRLRILAREDDAAGRKAARSAMRKSGLSSKQAACPPDEVESLLG